MTSRICARLTGARRLALLALAALLRALAHRRMRGVWRLLRLADALERRAS